jgi:2-polyprenyl-3-methyl-5-hydroxy-6-metoxy-1,4-benzoquinol methylase
MHDTSPCFKDQSLILYSPYVIAIFSPFLLMLLKLLSGSKDFWLPDMRRRLDVVEATDNPVSDTNQFNATLDHFALVNLLFTRTGSMVNTTIIRHMRTRPDRRFTVLSIGAEACDSGQWLLDACTRFRLNVHVTCVDQDTRVIEHAISKYGQLDRLMIIEGRAADILASGNKFDYIIANHFLNHIPQNRVETVLQHIDRSSECGFLIHDLTRSPIWYICFTAFAALFLRNSFAFYDGRISIRRGFTRQELMKAVEMAGLGEKARLRMTAPAQFYLYKIN